MTDEREDLATVHVLGARHPQATKDALHFDAIVQAALRRYAKEWAADEHTAEETS